MFRSCAYLDQALGWHVDTQCNAKIPFICKSNTDEVEQAPSKDDRGGMIDCDVSFGADWYPSSTEPGQELNINIMLFFSRLVFE